MKILFLSHYFPPETNAPASRTFEHCKHWAKVGHEVKVISCVPHHPMGRAYPGYRNKLYDWEQRDKVRVLHVLTYITPNKGFLKRTVNYFFYMVMTILAAPFLSRPDVVISTSPQFFNGLAGYFVSRMKRVPWVLEIRDLWPESILAVGAIKSRSVIRFLMMLESFVYKKADAIVVVSNAFTEHIIRHGGGRGKICYIPNGADLSLFRDSPNDLRLAETLGVKGKFVVAYVGTHGMAHGLDVILEAAEKLKAATNIVFLLVGDGAEKEKIKAQRNKMDLENVLLLDQQPKEHMPAIWSMSDVSLVVLRKRDIFKKVLPSKLFESMAMGVPIILAVEGESERLVTTANTGLCVEPENSEELANAVLKLYEDVEQRKLFAANGISYVQEFHDRAKLAKQYEELLVSVASKS